jgi:hypothetical protein
MTLRRLAISFALGAVVSACGEDAITGPSLDDLPNIAGAWQIEAALYPVGIAAGAGGSCTLSPMVITLQKSTAPSLGVAYRGTHPAGSLTCTGITAAATQSSGIRDTVIALPADSVQATVAYEICGGTFPLESPPCSTPLKSYLFLTFAGLTLTAVNPATTALTGELSWYDASEVGRLFGTWTANRSASIARSRGGDECYAISTVSVARRRPDVRADVRMDTSMPSRIRKRMRRS